MKYDKTRQKFNKQRKLNDELGKTAGIEWCFRYIITFIEESGQKSEHQHFRELVHLEDKEEGVRNTLLSQFLKS